MTMTENEAKKQTRALITRRQALQVVGATVTVAAASTLFESGPLSADAIEGLGRAGEASPEHQWAMVIDLQRCIGCQYCVWSCQAVNDVPDDARRWNVGFPEMTANGTEFYMTRPCLHCAEAPCVKVCPVGATWVREDGIVAMDYERCIGCRYCEVACPFNVPKFEWAKAAPKIVKCELCRHRLAEGKEPACTEVCPREAVVYGKYTDLLDDARSRLAAEPDKYVPKIYGEREVGGTQVLYLSHVPFENLGFRFDQEQSVPHVQQTVQHGVYQGFVAPVALYALLGAVMFRNRKTKKADEDEQ
jgi:Fe-S-cluster-containing dehydrogenase component